MARDPRSEAEKARADLARNAELGMAVPKSPLEERPSVTPRTFGDTSETGRVRSADQGIEAGGVRSQTKAPKDKAGAARPPDDADVLSRARDPKK